MLISVIIPTYNRGHFISKTLNSLLNQSVGKENYEIIIVDNNSNDNTADLVKAFIKINNDHTIRYLLEQRQGVHYARNSAAKVASGKYLYFTDDDMIANLNILDELLYLFTLDNRIVSVTGKVLPNWLVEPPSWILRLCNNYLLSLNDPPEELIISKNDCNVFSCHQMIIRSILIESGGFNPENTKGVWIGDGETGLNLKIKELGYLFAYNANAVTYHIIPPSRTTQDYLNKRFYNQGFCDSYTFYRHETRKNKLLYSVVKYFWLVIFNFLKFILFYLLQNIYWHLNLSKSYYYIARIKYNFKLLTSSNWRKMVLKKNWINE